MNYSFKNILSLDIETTGLNPKKHGIISIGAIKADTGEEFYRELILPYDISYEHSALKVNGETISALSARKTTRPPLGYPLDHYSSIVEALLELFEFSKDHAVVLGKNPSFDMGFLKHYAEMYLLTDKSPFSHRMIDYGTIAAGVLIAKGKELPKSGYSSKDIAEFFGIPEEAKPHNALNGARQNIIAFKAILSSIPS